MINPLTALYGCRNGDLQRYPEQIETLCREVASVMAMEGYHTSCEGLMQYVMDVIRSTADNVSSMLQDIRNQRHTGSTTSPVTCCAARAGHGLALPENARLFELIKRKENEYERIGAGLPGTW